MSMTNRLRLAVSRPQQVRNDVTVKTLAASGGLAVGELTETTARKLSAVDGCMEILSNSISKLPNFVMDGKTREHVDHYLLRLLNVRPNEAMTPSIRRKVLENSRNEGGNGYDWIIRDPRTGIIRELIPVPWWLVQPWRDEAGRVWYTVTHPVTGTPMVLPNEDICHYKATTRDGLTGISPLRRAREVLAAAQAAQAYDLAFYANGGQPSGVLETDSDLGGWAEDVNGKHIQNPDGSYQTRKDLLRHEWEKVHAGPSNSHRLAILDLGLKYTPIAATNKDAQFVENKEVTIRDIARYFGVPLYKLQEGKQAYGSNEQNAIEYVVSTLHPIVNQYAEEQTWKLLTNTELRQGLEIRINMMAELKGDTASRGAWYTNQRNNGVFSVNDIRALEDLPDVEGGDERRESLNYVPLKDWARLSEQRNGGNTNAGNT